MATPMVTGAIALLYAAADISRISFYKSNLTTGTLMFRDVLFDGVDVIPALQGITVTGGRLNVNNAVLEISTPIVPVELISFSAVANSNSVELNWSTATEINNSGFSVERISISNSNWIEIGFIPGFGTTAEPKSYSFTDEDISSGFYSYRLKQIDFDGSMVYSNVIDVEVAAPNKFSLEQNYPNPFNPATKIKFTIPAVETRHAASLQMVTMKVFDILGNEVATLVNEELPAGEYEVEFDSATLSGSVSAKGGYASGVYFYKLIAGSFSETRKMILAK